MSNETFELERFVWATPDRLEIDGRFIGLEDAPPGEPVLVLHGPDRTHRLPAEVSNGQGGSWRAAFTWQETPTPFSTAQLELGDDLVVELPEPSWTDETAELGVLDVRPHGAEGADRLRLQADLLALRSQLGEGDAQLERVRTELVRAREDLESERAGRARDAESFRAALAQAQATAQEAVAEAVAEAEALRARVDELAGTGAEAERLRAQLASIRQVLEGDPASP